LSFLHRIRSSILTHESRTSIKKKFPWWQCLFPNWTLYRTFHRCFL